MDKETVSIPQTERAEQVYSLFTEHERQKSQAKLLQFNQKAAERERAFEAQPYLIQLKQKRSRNLSKGSSFSSQHSLPPLYALKKSQKVGTGGRENGTATTQLQKVEMGKIATDAEEGGLVQKAPKDSFDKSKYLIPPKKRESISSAIQIKSPSPDDFKGRFIYEDVGYDGELPARKELLRQLNHQASSDKLRQKVIGASFKKNVAAFILAQQNKKYRSKNTLLANIKSSH